MTSGGRSSILDVKGAVGCRSKDMCGERVEDLRYEKESCNPLYLSRMPPIYTDERKYPRAFQLGDVIS